MKIKLEKKIYLRFICFECLDCTSEYKRCVLMIKFVWTRVRVFSVGGILYPRVHYLHDVTYQYLTYRKTEQYKKNALYGFGKNNICHDINCD